MDAYRDAERIAGSGADRSTVAGKGESMAPVFGDNTMLVVSELPYEQLAAGMMVAYRNREGKQVVHRLIAATRGGAWRVQGINNAREDPETVTRENYLGVVYASLVHEAQDE